MTYDPTRPADTDLVKKSAELIRENLEGLRKNGIVISKPPLYGVGGPKVTVGENGDRYIDTVTGNHYYKNFNGQWEPNLTLDDKYETVKGVKDIMTELQSLIKSTVEDCLRKVNVEYSPRVIGEYKLMSHNELADGWVKSVGSLYDPQKYPKAFTLYGTKHGGDGVHTFAVPDWRADAIRINDDGRGIDLGRELGSEQEDAIRNITGSINSNFDKHPFSEMSKSNTTASGALDFTYGYGYKAADAGTTNDTAMGIIFDASRIVPTANENRMRNRSCCMYVYIGRPGVDA